MKRAPRYVKVERNIYRYPDGSLEAKLRITGYPPKLERFAADTQIEKIRRWLADTAIALKATPAPRAVEAQAFGERKADGRRRPGSSTLELDAPGYWDQIKGTPRFTADRSHTRAWFDVTIDGERLGDLHRSAITWQHVNRAIAQWQTMPSPHAIRKVRASAYMRGTQSVKASVRSAPATSGAIVGPLTIRHRCRVLEELYRKLDGKKAPTPIDDADVPKRPKSVPVTVPVTTIETTLRTLSQLDAKTYARFAVVNTCAQRPCQVGRARPEDVNLEAGTWLVRSAKGAPAHTITLDEPQAAAWAVFLVAEAWGTFDTTKYGRLIHEAGWPAGIRPYAARHSFAAAAIAAGVNLGDLQALLGHSTPDTTRRSYAPFQIDRQRIVSGTMKTYLADVFKLRLVK